LVTDSHSNLARWRNNFSQLLNVHGFNDVRHTETHTAEPLMSEPSAFQIELATEKLKSHRSTGTAKIPARLKQGVEKFALSTINLLILIGIWRKCLMSGRSRSLYLPVRSAIKQIVVIIEAYHFCQLRTKFYSTSF